MLNNNQTPELTIEDIDIYLPESVLGNDQLRDKFEFARDFLDTKIGIRERRIAASDQGVADMALRAGRRLMERLDLDPQAIGALIVVTQNPDYKLPTTANLVQHHLGLDTSCLALDINQGCSGYVIGLATLKSLMTQHQLQKGLLITADAYSKVMDPNDRNTVPLFGDGAAVTLLSTKGAGRIGAFEFGSDGSGADHLIVRGGGGLNPMQAPVGENALYMNGREVFNFAVRRVPPAIKNCLKKNQLEIADIDYFVVHQASAFMVDALAKAIGVERAKMPFLLDDCGNTVSATLPMALQKLGGPAGLTGKKVLLAGFGVGLSWATTTVQF
ncbi:MAG: ketoacyl-ACP synthase III [Pseudomonadota bacterium]